MSATVTTTLPNNTMQLAEPMNEFSHRLSDDGDDIDLKKHHTIFNDDSTCATAFTSMSSLTDSLTVASFSTRSTRSSISVPTRSRRGSILKSPCNNSNSSKLDCSGRSTGTGFAKRRSSRISFSATPAQVFTIENKEEYYEDMFYDQESLADFRYEALMWEAGMVDENGTPKALIQSANESKSKYDAEDEMNGSLDFDELLLEELNPKSGNDKAGGNPLDDVEEDKAYSRENIKQLRRSIDASDLQWQGTSELFCNLEDLDDDEFFRDDDESVAGDDELNDDLDNPFSGLDADDALVGELTPKEKFEQQRRQLSFHKNKQQLEGHNFLNQKFSSFNLTGGSSDCLVFEPSDDGSVKSDEEDDSVVNSISERFQGAFACEDDSQQSERSVPCDSDSDDEAVIGDTSGRSFVRRAFEKRDSLRASFKSLSDVFLSTSQHSAESLLDGDSNHSANNNNKEEPPETRRSRLMLKMRGLRESLRSIQNLDDIDSDDDSEWGDDEEESDVNIIDTKNLKRSLIGKHKIYSPVPNQAHPTIDRMDSVKEMTIPEL